MYSPFQTVLNLPLPITVCSCGWEGEEGVKFWSALGGQRKKSTRGGKSRRARDGPGDARHVRGGCRRGLGGVYPGSEPRTHLILRDPPGARRDVRGGDVRGDLVERVAVNPAGRSPATVPARAHGGVAVEGTPGDTQGPRGIEKRHGRR